MTAITEILARKPWLDPQPVTISVPARDSERAFTYTFQMMDPEAPNPWTTLINKARVIEPQTAPRRYKAYGVAYPGGRMYWSDNIDQPFQLVNATQRIPSEPPVVSPVIFEIRQRNGENMPSVIFWASEGGAYTNKVREYFREVLDPKTAIVESPSV